MLTRFYFTLLFFLAQPYCFAQSNQPYSTLSSVIPPSPNAASLTQAGFSDVNLYTGKASYSLSLYTVSQNGINFPISLTYTGGGGIRVEEVASSVGLGWSITSAGAVSRAIRGRADDTYAGSYIGYIHLPDFDPATVTYDSAFNYAKNKHDGQPDIYSVNVAGISAQFYINKSKKVVFVEKTDLKIEPVFSGYEIIAFELKDTNGRLYYFNVKEKSKCTPISDSSSEFDEFSTSSWYLTKIVSEYGKEIVSFTYQSGDEFETKQYLRSPYQHIDYNFGDEQMAFDESADSWSTLLNKKVTLQKIQFAGGEIDFIVSDSNRYDLSGDKYLKQVVVKNLIGDTVKNFVFYHSYFGPTGTIHQGQGAPTYGYGGEYRLKLDSLKDRSRTQNSLNYGFVYDTSHFLPDRLWTFATDHWGFYNGKTTNTGWEGKNRAKFYTDSPVQPLDSFLVENGSADRNANIEFTEAGVLRKVITPTGGEVNFNYELNSSANPELPNELQMHNQYLTVDDAPNYFTIDLINEPFGYATISALINADTYSYEYNLRDSLLATTNILDTIKYGETNHAHKLEQGTYFIKIRRLGSLPDTSLLESARVNIETEILIPNKIVGGLRIKNMQVTDLTYGANLQRNYFYNEAGDSSSNSLSTGEISNVPKYGRQTVEIWNSSYEPSLFSFDYCLPQTYYRFLSSAYPLGVTSGSHVGYRKVTVVDSNALRTESYFTSFKDFPEYRDGYYPGESKDVGELLINGKKYEKSPLAPTDERDYLRGKLTKQIMYEKFNGQFRKISETENQYVFNMGMQVSRTKIVLPDVYEFISGMVFNLVPNSSDPAHPAIDWKKYDLYTSKYDIKKIINKQYSYQPTIDSIVNETTIEYDDSPWHKDSLFHYQPTKFTKKTFTDSEVQKIYYPYHWRYGVPDANSGEEDNMELLETANRIAIPVLQITEDSATGNHKSSVKNLYAALVNAKLAVNVIKTKQGSAASFEDRISFNRYDTLGNLVEQQKTEDNKSSFIWDYKSSYPIAEVTNADSASIAYTSFEAEGKGNWSFSGAVSDTVCITGKKAYKFNGSNNISKAGLSSGSIYIVSYWSRNASAFSITGSQSGYPIAGQTVNGWKYFEHKVTGQTTITVGGTGWIDELRLYPDKAMMNTLTYTPLIGISSSCDANNRISYYEYDGFNRLTLVRNQDKNIVKRICYNYAGQPENCSYYFNTAISDTIARNNCSEGYTSSSVIYSVSAGIYGSAISQADANLQALNDISVNGQAYANANGTCTIVCNSGNCSGTNKKCINNICETGVKVNTDSYWHAGMSKWACIYHYEWSDNSWSIDYTSYSNMACPY